MKKFVSFIIINCFLHIVISQSLTDSTYNTFIHTIQVSKKNWELSYPILELNSNEQLIISFDDLSKTSKNYWYKLTHCNASWEPEDITYTEYIDGFEQNAISNIQYSNNTTVPYFHYKFYLPNNDVQFKLSGNYLLTVFENADSQKIAFTKKLYLTESNALIELNIFPPQLPRYSKRNQQFILKVKPLLNDNINLQEDITCFLFRNFDPLSKQKVTFSFINENATLVSDDPVINIINGSNEFRNFDIKSIKYQSPRIKSINYDGENYYIDLYPDEWRNKTPYLSDIDLNGKFFIENSRGNNKDVDADYFKIHFSLHSDFLSTEQVYLYGELSNWSLTPYSKMEYNFNNKCYELNLLLKQGYYNYNYKLISNESEINSTENIEGDHFETENDYIVLVYYKNNFLRYERLIAYRISNSIKKASSN